MDSSDVPRLLILVVLLILSAFFSSAETALTSVNKLRIRSLAEDGNKQAQIVRKLTDDPSKMLSAILIGNNIVNLSASSLSTVLATKFAANQGVPVSTATVVGIATGILTILVLIFGEITPKSAATIHAEKLSLRIARIILWLTRILTPVIFIVNRLAHLFMSLIGIDPNSRSQIMTEDELLTAIDVSHEEGVIESEEKEMINNVVDFGESIVADVMVPRIDMKCLDVESSYTEVFNYFRQIKYSRLPIYEKTKDHIVGILNLKDVFYYRGRPEDFSVQSVMRPAYFVYDFQKISDLLVQMRQNSISIMIVLDEYCDVAGLVTLEDLLEEIVGEIRDEYDVEEKDDIRQLSPNSYMVLGQTRLDDINELLGLTLNSEDYDSIAGHIIHELGHIPSEGEAITIDNIRLSVALMNGNRIENILIQLSDDFQADTSDK